MRTLCEGKQSKNLDTESLVFERKKVPVQQGNEQILSFSFFPFKD
jgi:hypothetical protein